MDVEKEAENLDLKAQEILADLYKNLTPWRKCQIARHPERPHCKDYIKLYFQSLFLSLVIGILLMIKQ